MPLRRLAPAAVAAGLIASVYLLSLPPAATDAELDRMAAQFGFARRPLAKLPGVPHQSVRRVHPSLHHLRTMISFVGAAVTAADLDGDGLPNDLIHVDPRIDRAVVMPAPGTGDRYPPFALTPDPLPFAADTTAPMGSLVGDFDEDGREDVLVYYWGRPPLLFLQRGGAGVFDRSRFEPRELVEPFDADRRWFTSAVTRADVDGDGHPDLILGQYYRDGSRILDATAGGSEQMPQSASQAFNGGGLKVFLWTGQARYRESEGLFPGELGSGWVFALAAVDLDGDLLPEVYAAHDFGPDRLFHNRSRPGQPAFTAAAGERGVHTPRSLAVGRDSFNGMGIDTADLNADGLPDLFVSNITCPAMFLQSHFLFLSTGEPGRLRDGVAPYRNVASDWGVAATGWSWGAKFADFDNDGGVELLQATGCFKGTVNRWPELHEYALTNDGLAADPRFWHKFEPGDDVSGGDHNRFFVRGTDGRFHDLASRLALATPMVSRDFAPADVDGDGGLDFAVANNWEPSAFFANTAADRGAFLGLHVRLPVADGGRATVRPGHPKGDDPPSRVAVGAHATVHLADGRKLIGFVDGGNGHSGRRAPDLHFGLGRAAPVNARVDLRWRDAGGVVREQSHTLHPGWHTVTLGAGE